MSRQAKSLLRCAAAAMLLATLAGCATHHTETRRRFGVGDSQRPIEIFVDPIGNPILFGETMRYDEFEKVLKRNNWGKKVPITLISGPGTPKASMMSMMNKLNRRGFPNISIASEMRGSAEIVDEDVDTEEMISHSKAATESDVMHAPSVRMRPAGSTRRKGGGAAINNAAPGGSATPPRINWK